MDAEKLRRARMMEDLMLGRGEIGGPFTLTDHTGARRSLDFYTHVLGFTQTGYYPIESDPIRTEVRRDDVAGQPALSLAAVAQRLR